MKEKLCFVNGKITFLQVLTQFEGAIKRDKLLSSFETTEELLSYCASSKNAGFDASHTGSVPQLPWIPQTTAAVALRLLELDASISYSQQETALLPDEKKVEYFIVELSYPLCFVPQTKFFLLSF